MKKTKYELSKSTESTSPSKLGLKIPSSQVCNRRGLNKVTKFIKLKNRMLNLDLKEELDISKDDISPMNPI